MRKLVLCIAALMILAARGDAQYKMQNQTAPDETRVVKIYLVQTKQTNAGAQKRLVAARRRINPKTPLAETFYKSIVGAYNYERSEGFSSLMSGLIFDSATLENGTARINFKSGAYFNLDDEDLREFFVEAVEKTARQFRRVKRVEICLDNISNFFRTDGEPPQKCS